MGLALLVQFTPQLLLPLPGQAPLLAGPQQWLEEDLDAGQREPPWQLLRECLVRLLVVLGQAVWGSSMAKLLMGLHSSVCDEPGRQQASLG